MPEDHAIFPCSFQKDLLRLLLFVPVVWLVFYLTTLIHEAGHLIAYLLGTKSWHI